MKDATKATPLECPRGWGDVLFRMKVGGMPFPPFLEFSRRCPIAGVEKCIKCRYPFNPQKTELLRDELMQLRSLVDDGLMSEAEYKARRKMIISFQQFGTGEPGYASAVATFILAPIGAVITIAGLLGAQNIHPGFWGVVAGGVLALVLGGSFAGISYWRRRDTDRRQRDIDKLFAADSDF